MLGTLDPKTYFGERTGKPSLAQNEIDKTRTAIENYINKQPATMRFPEQGKRYDWVKSNIWANFTWNHPNDTVNDVKSFEDIYYVDKYYTNSDTQGIGDIFREIFEQITGASFIPIDGDNDNGVANSLTYMDPIGEYMEVKDNAVNNSEIGEADMSMLLFGEMHGLVRTGVYDYDYNVEHGITSKADEGWYSNTTNKKLGSGETDSNWKEATYRLCGDTTREYVSTLDEGNLTNKQRNTTYTLYRFKDDYNTRNETRKNPSYEEDRNVTYKLSDIRVWLEETDDYVDDSQSGAVDLGYDDALFVNIPVGALPIELATVSLDTKGDPISYKTNLANKKASTPLRLFYGVGIQDDIRTEDERSIDITKLSPEYRQKNTDDDGFINFYSNWYSGTTHSHGKEEPKTIGDANFTFSPNSTNRYYAFQKPLILYEDNSENHEEISEVDNPTEFKEFNEKKESTIIDSADKLDSEKYYYIEGEYYVAGDNGKGKLVHIVVSRKGSEFGSEIAGDVGAGEYLAWYNPDTGDYIPYTNQREDGTIEATPKPEEGNYVIATKPQGLRMGQICVNNVPKDDNKTSTAGTVYYPQISNNTTAKDIIIDGYLGNNGRIRVKDTTLEITKEVEGYVGNQDYKDEEFEYTINIPAYANENQETINAISILKNEKYVQNGNMQKWIMKPGTIEVIPDNVGFVQTTEVNEDAGTSSYKLAEYNGQYMYVGLNENLTFDLYDSSKDPYFNPNITPEQQLPGVGEQWSAKNDGSIEYYANVHLVPKDKVDGKEFDTSTIEDYPTEKVVLATLDATKPIEEQVSSDYYTRTAYATIPLVFDKNGDAKFTLKHDQGILITGIDSSTTYTVTENLTDEQKQKGYRFDHAYNSNNADLQSTDGKVSGTINQDSREIHYVNMDYMPNNISISKIVKGSDPEAKEDIEKETEWHFNMSLTFHDGEDHGESVSYDYYDKKDTEFKDKLGTIEFKKNSADGTYVGHFTLKHNDNITIKGIFSGTEYEITEEEASEHGENPEGYYTTFKNGTDKGVIGGTQQNIQTDIQVECVNFNPSEEDITIRKQVKGETADTNADWEFELTLTPTEEFSLEDSYEYEKAGETGTLKLGEPDENGVRKATVKLKHGEYITIKGLPEGTKYTVVEINANTDGYTTEVPEESNGTLEADGEVDMTFVNSLIKYYDLTLNKTVAGHYSNENDTFKFKVTFTPGADFGLEPINYAYTNGASQGRLVLPGKQEQPGDIELKAEGQNYYAEFDLKHNQTIIFSNIIEGTKYNIEEKLEAAQTGENGYKPKLSDQSAEPQGTLGNENRNPRVEFVNIRYALNDLEISKKVEGQAGETNRQFRFKVTFTPAADVDFGTSYPYTINGVAQGNLQLTDNKDGTYTAEFTLRHDQHLIIKDIPERTQYLVEELDANQDGYDTSVSKGQANGAFVGPNIDQDIEVEFTNRKLAYYGLTVAKNVEGENADTNREFKFKITFIPAEDVKELAASYPYTGSKSGNLQLTDNKDGTYTAEFTLKGGQRITINGIPERTEYIVEELDANQDGYVEHKTDNTQGTLDGRASSTVTYTNIKTPAHSLTLSKETQGGASGNTTTTWNFEIRLTPPTGTKIEKLTYTGGTIIDGSAVPASGELTFTEDPQQLGTYVATVQLKHGQSITINDIPEGTKYSVTEAEANKNGFITYLQGEATGTVSGNVGIVVAYKNKKAAPMDLTLMKTVKGSRGDKNADWHFDIKLTPEENVNLESRYPYSGTKRGYLTLEKQSDGSYLGHLTLKHNDKITISGLPAGTLHEIVEREANQNEYTTEVNGQTTGKLTESGREIEFVNTRLGYYDLSINKTVMGRLGDRTRDWKFQIVLNIPDAVDQTVNYTYAKTLANGTNTTGTLTFTRNALGNYEAEITLKHNETITIQNLIEGTQYTVTEPESNKDGYTTTHTENCQGTIVDNGELVEFVNRYLSTIDLNLKKVVKGALGETDRDWTFRVTLTPPRGVSLSSTYHYSGSREGDITFTQNQNGTYTGTISIKHNETLTIEGLPEDTIYNVEEVEANQDGYTTTNSGNTSGNLTIDTDDVTFVNTRLSKHDLTVEKIVEGGAGDKSREWNFEIILTPDEGVTLNNSYVYTGSKEGNLILTKNSDGTYTGKVTLKHGETITVKDLPEGTQYKIVEVEANKEGYTTKVTENSEGRLQGEGTPVVTFRNKKLAKRDLTIKKTVQGAAGDKTRDWTFEITLIPGQGNTLDNTYKYLGSKEGNLNLTKNPDGTYTGRITLKHGETITIKDLPEETQYKVIELEADKEGYTTSVTENHEGTITNSNIVVEFFNTKTPTITKTVLKKWGGNNNSKISNVRNPRTSDNVKGFVALFFVAITIIAISANKLLKKNKGE